MKLSTSGLRRAKKDELERPSDHESEISYRYESSEEIHEVWGVDVSSKGVKDLSYFAHFSWIVLASTSLDFTPSLNAEY